MVKTTRLVFSSLCSGISEAATVLVIKVGVTVELQ